MIGDQLLTKNPIVLKDNYNAYSIHKVHVCHYILIGQIFTFLNLLLDLKEGCIVDLENFRAFRAEEQLALVPKSLES